MKLNYEEESFSCLLSLFLKKVGIIFLQAFRAEAMGIIDFCGECTEMLFPFPDAFGAPYFPAD